MDRREILAEIDATVDQLIENAEALKGIAADPSYEAETLALKKTQESLLARLLHMQDYLNGKASTEISEKLPEFGNLSPSLTKQIKASFPSKPRVKKKKA